MLVEVNNEEAILRSATEFQTAGALKLPIPYRDNCAYTLANGKFFSSQKLVVKPFGQRGSHHGVFVFGGVNERRELTSSCEFYDSRTDR